MFRIQHKIYLVEEHVRNKNNNGKIGETNSKISFRNLTLKCPSVLCVSEIRRISVNQLLPDALSISVFSLVTSWFP
jgi:hypothetical protein